MTYPKSILNGSLIATIDGVQESLKQIQNGTSSYSVTVNYGQGAHTIVLSCANCSIVSISTSELTSTSTTTLAHTVSSTSSDTISNYSTSLGATSATTSLTISTSTSSSPLPATPPGSGSPNSYTIYAGAAITAVIVAVASMLVLRKRTA